MGGGVTGGTHEHRIRTPCSPDHRSQYAGGPRGARRAGAPTGHACTVRGRASSERASPSDAEHVWADDDRMGAPDGPHLVDGW